MSDFTASLRVGEPYPGIFAYYDGRIEGRRLHSDRPNWLDDGAYSLGIASYAILDGVEALVYDTHMSLAHAAAIRDHLEALGARSIRVVLSHWHTDHIAGNAAFADCEIVALKGTADAMAANREKLENGDPPIAPVVMPTRLFETKLELAVGKRRIELHHFDIHSADGNVLWLPDEGILLAGDTLEDTVTYISEPQNIATHIRELERMRKLPIKRILPNHGALERIAGGGYEPTLIDANRRYLIAMSDVAAGKMDPDHDLASFVADDIATGAILYFAPYESVHAENIVAVLSGSKPER
ncbi:MULTISPECIES: MBL fold metallo-hydrolase [Rhizobium]|uniref:MBL fold metallo-hydrolase n=1 Tax=Rhizobium rhododendri TaxID=2506430 RepID=A0ABY8IIC5_9HYPH|nr:MULTISPECIES: MBL fold metallo-hydrolase [Rhizobium]MBZ5761109.1 MBL fold metallo-hydrolase [Rhizobium sp. VS19-DR96]MBZ5767203.1 MBL fold metallo-hydrolase [Rhizobium sp. VS19-DR129.2]MBZ5773508.1 MBL fold metallo-hydrolase [Rhizobium sp. VS19-DRK62.2]MBZ5785515.1 MBL fold metallo-hydrolase [Rhizobium sp. VS19-DR121]MBZ5802336.1 MBL fold metallo-hydrolase [Rhizobium sp. VS19-DR181]